MEPPVKKRDKVRSAWISFAGRIVAQLIGAIATVTLGVVVLGGHARQGAAALPMAAAEVPVAPIRAAAHPAGAAVVAVLPLDDYTSEARPDHFVDGVTEALIMDLSQVGHLSVVSRTSAAHVKARQLPLPQIAGELGVDFVVEGSVARAGGRVRVTVQLIDARTDAHVWAQSYDRDAADAISLQAEVAGAIARDVAGQLTAIRSAAEN